MATTVLDVKVGDTEIFPAVFSGNTYYSKVSVVSRMYLGTRKVYEIHPNVARWIRRVELIDGQPLEKAGRLAIIDLVNDLVAGNFWSFITTCIITCLARTAQATNLCLAHRYYSDNGVGPGLYYVGFHDVLSQYYDRKRGMLFPAGSKAGYAFMPNAPPWMPESANGMANFVVYSNEMPIDGAKCSIFSMISPIFWWNPSSELATNEVLGYSGPIGTATTPGRGFRYNIYNQAYLVDPGTATCKTTATQTNKQAQWQMFIDGLPVGTPSVNSDSYLAFDRKNLYPMDYGASTYVTYNTDGIANGGISGPQSAGNDRDSRMQIGICIYDPTLWNNPSHAERYALLHNILDTFIQKVAALP